MATTVMNRNRDNDNGALNANLNDENDALVRLKGLEVQMTAVEEETEILDRSTLTTEILDQSEPKPKDNRDPTHGLNPNPNPNPPTSNWRRGIPC